MSISSPYRGLAAFEDSELDALYFFGRERDSEIVVANLIAARLTVLYGPSGVGKSSLLLASVARALRALPEEPLVVVFSSWNEAPEQALARAVARGAGVEPGALVDVATLAQTRSDVYLILDQAEEYFTYHGEGDGFDSALAAVVDAPLRVNVLLSLREDALASLDRLKGAIPNLFGNVLRLDRLDRTAGRAAIVKPLERWNALEGDAVAIEDELVGDVLDGVGAGRIELGPGGPRDAGGENGRTSAIEAPYLQLVMLRLWEVERSQGSSSLRAATLTGLGGAAQVVADHLERAIEALTPTQRDVAARLFDHLVTPSGMKIAHATSDLAQFAGVPESEVTDVLHVLAEHRILRTDEAGRWEIFHDVLAGAVLGWKTRHEAERAVQRAKDEARRRHRRLAFLAFGALVALAATGALTLFAFSQRSEARDQARAARSGQLVASALSVEDTDPELGIELALEAARLEPTQRAETALRDLLDASRLRAVIDTGQPVVGLDLDPLASRALVVGDDGIARLFDLATGDLRWSHRVDGGGAAFSNGGRSVVLIEDSSLVTLDAATGAQRRSTVPVALAGPVEELVPSTDGRSAIVVTLGKPRARAVALATGDVIGRVKHPRAVTDAAYAPTGRLAVSSGRDWAGRVWDTATWREVREPLLGHNGQVLAIAFDAAGTGRIATASTDQTARVWRLRARRSSATLFGHTAPVNDVAFGPGSVLATASGDGTARTWRAEGKAARELLGHEGPVRKVEFASDGRVVTGGADGTVRIWDPGTGVDLARAATTAGPSPARKTASTADGSAIATADGDVIRLRTGSRETLLEGHDDDVNSVSFSPDGRLLVSAGRDHDVIVWDVAGGREAFRLDEAQSATVEDARFSPDGRWLVTAGPRSARLWTAEGELGRYLYGPRSPVTAVAFEPDSRGVVSLEQDGDAKVVRRWRCEVCGELDELTALARERLRGTGRTLSDEERARYLR
jgi:WD40 repeat protein